MEFTRVTLDDILGELRELPSDWMDDTARIFVPVLRRAVGELRVFQQPMSPRALADYLSRNPSFLDVCRLFLGAGQETVAHMLAEELGLQSVSWSRLRKLARDEPTTMAQALVGLGIAESIREHLSQEWSLEDILVERYKLMRGRAIAGQHRGRQLEQRVAGVLEEISVSFEKGVTFTGQLERTAKCDFAIPTKLHPKIVIEVKAFEATGSKLTDFLGDILKIGQAKDYHMYLLLVTDGRGWRNRRSDLAEIIKQHREGLIDMIYTSSRLPQLASDVRKICDTELQRRDLGDA